MALGKKQITTTQKLTKPVTQTTAAKSTTVNTTAKKINNTPTTTKTTSTPIVTGAAAGVAGLNLAKNNSSSANPISTGATAGVSNVASNAAKSTTPNTSRLTNPSSSVTTPTVSSIPTQTAPTVPTTGGLIGTSVNAADTLSNLISASSGLPTQTAPDVLANAHAVNTQMAAKPNEAPSETTQRYLNLMGSVTGGNTRPYSNPNYSYNTNVGRTNNTGYNYGNSDLEDIVQNSIYNSLVGEVGSDKPFAEVPQWSLNNANLAVNGPTAVVANQNNTPTLSDLIAAQFANDYGTPGTNNIREAYFEGTDLNPYAAASSATSERGAKGDGSDIYNTNNVGGSGGYGTRGVGGGNGGVPAYESAYDLDALYDLLNRQLAEYNNQYDSLMANLLSAYDMNNASLDDYYNQVLAALRGNYDDTENYLNGQFGNSQQALEDDRRRALQEAYIARMMNEKQLRDQLDAYGLTGGASESVMANLMNNYMNNRASVEEKTQASLKDLLQNYLGNVSNARQSYNQALMNAEQNRLNARQGYANNLAEAQANAANYLANARSGAYENLFNALAKQYLG